MCANERALPFKVRASPQGDFTSPLVRLGYSSLVTPFSIIDVDMATGAGAADAAC